MGLRRAAWKTVRLRKTQFYQRATNFLSRDGPLEFVAPKKPRGAKDASKKDDLAKGRIRKVTSSCGTWNRAILLALEIRRTLLDE
jgi:hypothetical protein